MQNFLKGLGVGVGGSAADALPPDRLTPAHVLPPTPSTSMAATATASASSASSSCFVVPSGLPPTADAVAYDPVQRLLAVATASSPSHGPACVKVFGREGVELTLVSVAADAGGGGSATGGNSTLQLRFLLNRGAVARLSSSGVLEVWSIDDSGGGRGAGAGPRAPVARLSLPPPRGGGGGGGGGGSPADAITCFAPLAREPFLLLGCASGSLRVACLVGDGDASTAAAARASSAPAVARPVRGLRLTPHVVPPARLFPPSSWGEEAAPANPPPPGPITSVSAHSPAPGRHLALVVVRGGEAAVVWDVGAGAAVAALAAAGARPASLSPLLMPGVARRSGRITAACWMPGSARGGDFATGHEHGDINVWRLPGGRARGLVGAPTPSTPGLLSQQRLLSPSPVPAGRPGAAAAATPSCRPVRSLAYLGAAAGGRGLAESLLVLGGQDEDRGPDALALLPLPPLSGGGAGGGAAAAAAAAAADDDVDVDPLVAAAKAAAAEARALEAAARVRGAPPPSSRRTTATSPDGLLRGGPLSPPPPPPMQSPPPQPPPPAPVPVRLPWFGAILGTALVPSPGALTGHEDPVAVLALTEGGELVAHGLAGGAAAADSAAAARAATAPTAAARPQHFFFTALQGVPPVISSCLRVVPARPLPLEGLQSASASMAALRDWGARNAAAAAASASSSAAAAAAGASPAGAAASSSSSSCSSQVSAWRWIAAGGKPPSSSSAPGPSGAAAANTAAANTAAAAATTTPETPPPPPPLLYCTGHADGRARVWDASGPAPVLLGAAPSIVAVAEAGALLCRGAGAGVGVGSPPAPGDNNNNTATTPGPQRSAPSSSRLGAAAATNPAAALTSAALAAVAQHAAVGPPVTAIDFAWEQGVLVTGHSGGQVRAYQFCPQARRLDAAVFESVGRGDRGLAPAGVLEPAGFQLRVVVLPGVHDADVTAVRCCPTHRTVVVGDASGSVSLLDLSRPAVRWLQAPLPCAAAALAMARLPLPAPRERHEALAATYGDLASGAPVPAVVVAGEDGSVAVLDGATGFPLGRGGGGGGSAGAGGGGGGGGSGGGGSGGGAPLLRPKAAAAWVGCAELLDARGVPTWAARDVQVLASKAARRARAHARQGQQQRQAEEAAAARLLAEEEEEAEEEQQVRAARGGGGQGHDEEEDEKDVEAMLAAAAAQAGVAQSRPASSPPSVAAAAARAGSASPPPPPGRAAGTRGVPAGHPRAPSPPPSAEPARPPPLPLTERPCAYVLVAADACVRLYPAGRAAKGERGSAAVKAALPGRLRFAAAYLASSSSSSLLARRKGDEEEDEDDEDDEGGELDALAPALAAIVEVGGSMVQQPQQQQQQQQQRQQQQPAHLRLLVLSLPGLKTVLDVPLADACRGWQWRPPPALQQQQPQRLGSPASACCSRRGHLALLGESHTLLRLMLSPGGGPLAAAPASSYDWELAAAADMAAASAAAASASAATAAASTRQRGTSLPATPLSPLSPPPVVAASAYAAAAAAPQAKGDGVAEPPAAAAAACSSAAGSGGGAGAFMQRLGADLNRGLRQALEETHRGLARVAAQAAVAMAEGAGGASGGGARPAGGAPPDLAALLSRPLLASETGGGGGDGPLRAADDQVDGRDDDEEGDGDEGGIVKVVGASPPPPPPPPPPRRGSAASTAAAAAPADDAAHAHQRELHASLAHSAIQGTRLRTADEIRAKYGRPPSGAGTTASGGGAGTSAGGASGGGLGGTGGGAPSAASAAEESRELLARRGERLAQLQERAAGLEGEAAGFAAAAARQLAAKRRL